MENATANNALLEAMACGLPVIAERVGGIPEYVNDRCARLVAPGDSQSAARAILELHRAHDLTFAMSQAARLRAEELDWTHVADQTRGVYESILNGKSGFDSNLIKVPRDVAACRSPSRLTVGPERRVRADSAKGELDCIRQIQMPSSTSQSPLFSVVIPTYGRLDLLRHALESVCAQRFQDFEVIVVDDGSTDDLSGLIQDFQHRVTFVRQENRGPGAARNRGAAEAKGEYLAFLDSDDLWFPWTLAEFAQLIQEHHWPAILGGRLIEFSDVAELSDIHQDTSQSRSYADYFASSNICASVGAGTVVVRREEFLKADGFRPGLVNAEDHDLMLRMGTVAGFVQVVTPVTVAWRRHADSLTANLQRTYEGSDYLVAQERRRAYPGGPERLRARHRILLRHLRATAVGCVRHGLKREAWKLYWETYRWNLALGRFRFLLGFPLIAVSTTAHRALVPRKGTRATGDTETDAQTRIRRRVET